jgi:copper chaperone
MEQIRIPIKGMSCGGCVRSVQHALGRLPGVQVESVDVGSAVVSYDPSLTDRAVLARAIEGAGFVPQL